MMRTLVLGWAIVMLGPYTLSAQSPTASMEVSVTGGTSTEDAQALATQVRLFGELARDLRFYVEGAWGLRSETTSDVFGAAYPYDSRLRPIEVFGEKLFRGEKVLAGVRAGRYRTPFGIYNRSDHAYSGFLRAPLVRYDGYWALSNNHLEGGVDVFGGRPDLQVEASFGIPQDVGSAIRRRGLNRVVRVQGYRGAFIVGASHIRSKPSERRSFAVGDSTFTGIDLRWMRGGTQLRGEWITGRPFDGPSTTGWYVDAMVHRRALGPVTLVARAEELDYDAGPRSRYMQRYTAGARAQLPHGVVAHVNAVHQPHRMHGRRTALDVAVSYVVRYPW